MYYLIQETLVPCLAEDLKGEEPFVAILTTKEWLERRESFDMGIDIYQDFTALRETKALVNYDCLTGSLSIPSRTLGDDSAVRFAFALDERGVFFIDDTGRAARIVGEIASVKKWRLPSLERFFYDFLEEIIAGDLLAMEKMEQTLIEMEDGILEEKSKADTEALNRRLEEEREALRRKAGARLEAAAALIVERIVKD